MVAHRPSFTITVPAFNEEGAIGPTLDTILGVLQQGFDDYEILVFDDGSTDRTGRIADSYAEKYPAIQAIHNPKNMGIGYAYRKGVERASKNYYILIHGDNEISPELIREVLRSAGKADFTITHIEKDTRPLGRQWISRLFTSLINGMFGLHVRYYNGPSLIPVALLKEIPILTDGHAFMAEIIVRLSQRGYRCTSVGFETRVRAEGKSKAFRLKNVLSVLKALRDLEKIKHS